MKGTAAILRSHIGVGLLRILVPALLGLAAAGAFLLVTSPAAAGPPIDDLNLPVELEETRDPPKRVTRDVQGQGASITQQTSSPLVKNTGQASHGGISFAKDYGQAFTTGSHSDGYTLTSVGIMLQLLGNVQQPTYSVYITDDSGGKPGTSLGTLTTTTALTSNWKVVNFSAAGDGIELDANTTYWVVLDASGSSFTARLNGAGSGNEDSGGAAGWSMANEILTRSLNDTDWTDTGTQTSPAMLSVNGYAILPPALVSAEVNGTSLVLTYEDDLDTTSRTAARQFGIKFGGGALERATAISISGKQVTLTVERVRAGQLVTVSYTVPTSNPLRGSNGAKIDALSDQAVTVNTGPAYGRSETGKVRDAVYVTESNGEVSENRAASADRETLYDYFYDSCSAARSVTTVHDYSWRNADGHLMQARNGWKYVEVQNAAGEVTGTRPQTVDECASHGMYLRQQNCASEDWRRWNPHLLNSTCPDDRSW